MSIPNQKIIIILNVQLFASINECKQIVEIVTWRNFLSANISENDRNVQSVLTQHFLIAAI